MFRKLHSTSLNSRFNRIVLLTAVPFFLALTLTASLFFLVTRTLLRSQVEQATETLHEAIVVQLDNSIRSYLRSKVETAADLIRYHSGLGLKDEELIKSVSDHLLSIDVGESGYYYAVDSMGRVLFHPDQSIVNTSFAGESPVDAQILMKEGYLEYMWQNSDESEPNKKALYMTYLPELDWIITATSYRKEFTSMVDRESLKKIINNSAGENGGYSYIVDRDGQMIAHPYLDSISDSEDFITEEEFLQIIDNFFQVREGFTKYMWRDSPDQKRRVKTVYLKYLDDFDWVIGTAVYHGQWSKRVIQVLILSLVFIVIFAILLYLYLKRSNRVISANLSHIITALDKSREGNLSVRVPQEGLKEFSSIAKNLNYLLDSLERRTADLTTLNNSLEQRAAERTKALEAATDQLIESERLALTSRLVAGVAHEINTPTGVALTAFSYQREQLRQLETLVDEKIEDSKVKAVLQRVVECNVTGLRNLERSVKLISGFKNVSADNIAMDERTINIEQIIDDILLSMRLELERSNVTVQTDYKWTQLKSYPGVFIHTLVNLLNNSLKHGFENKQKGEIHIWTEKTNGYLILNYMDNGKGITEEVQKKIFDPFFTTGRMTGSIGLGMNIVKNLVATKLHGTISVKKAPKGGVQFTISFPESS